MHDIWKALIILAYEKLAFRKNTNLVVEPCMLIFATKSWVACEYIQKYSLACPWLFTWPGMEEQEYEEEFFGDDRAN